MSAFTVSVPTRFSDLDLFGHVSHVAFLTYCEAHRSSMFAELHAATGTDLLSGGFVVARVEGDYRSPISPAIAAVQVEATVQRIGGSSIVVRYRVLAPELSAEFVQTLVFVHNGDPRPVTDPERKWLERYAEGEHDEI